MRDFLFLAFPANRQTETLLSLDRGLKARRGRFAVLGLRPGRAAVAEVMAFSTFASDALKHATSGVLVSALM